MKLRAPTRLLVAGSTVLVAAVLGVLALATAPKQAASGASISAGCPKGEPVQKCLYKRPANFKPVTVPPITSPPNVVTLPASGNQDDCGALFLSASETSLLQEQFGSIECYRFANTRTWVLVGNGITTTGPSPSPPTPGGPVVGLDACAPGDSTCMNADAPHPLSDFTLYYPPGPIPREGMAVQASYGDRLLVFAGFIQCGGMTVFDIQTHAWLGMKANLSAILAGAKEPVLASPAPVPATSALTQATPPRTSC